MNQISHNDVSAQTIIQIIEEKKPQNVNQLAILVHEQLHITEEQALDTILELQNQGKIKLESQIQPTTLNLTSYLRTNQALWFWITVVLALSALVAVFLVPENLAPWSYLRNIIGAVFVLWLPGYALIKALFPVNLPIKTSARDLNTIERIALSLGTSLAIVPLVGLVLNYTIWGVRLTPIVLILLTITLIFAVVAIVREHQAKSKPQISLIE